MTLAELLRRRAQSESKFYGDLGDLMRRGADRLDKQNVIIANKNGEIRVLRSEIKKLKHELWMAKR